MRKEKQDRTPPLYDAAVSSCGATWLHKEQWAEGAHIWPAFLACRRACGCGPSGRRRQADAVAARRRDLQQRAPAIHRSRLLQARKRGEAKSQAGAGRLAGRA